MFNYIDREMSDHDTDGQAYTVSFQTTSGKIYRKVDVLKHTAQFLLIRASDWNDGPQRFISTDRIEWIQINEL